MFAILRQRIEDGTYAVGDRLPPEDDLAAEFNVSRATLRQAVGDLVQGDMVSRKQGRGTFVLPREPHTIGQRFRGSLADLISETRRAKVRDVNVERSARIPDRIAGLLELDEPVGVIVRRTRYMDGAPFAYTVNYLPSRFEKLLTKASLKEHGMMTLLEQNGVTFTGATQTIKAQLADVEVARDLNVTFASPVLFVERLLTDQNDDLVEFVQTWYRGDEYEYTVTFEQLPQGALQEHLA